MKKINILFVGMSSNLGGIEVFGKELMMHSCPDKFQFTLLLEDDTVVPFQEELSMHGVKIIRFPSRKNGYIKHLTELKRIFKHNDFDIIHINLMTYSPFELVKYACKYSDAKVIVHSHNAGYKKGYYRSRLLDGLGRIALIGYSYEKIACGNEAGRYFFGNKEYLVFNNGIDFSKYEFSPKNRKLVRSKYNISNQTVLWGDVASFLPQKNQVFLIHLFNAFHKNNSNSKLLLVGVGPEMEKCKRLTEQLGIEESVLFLGRQNDVERFYSAMDVFVMPSISEGLSISLCEAQVNGLTCFTSTGVDTESDISGNVFFIDLNSLEDWMKHLSSYPDRMHSIPKTIKKQFDIINSTNEIFNYYYTLASIGGRNE